MTFAYNFHDLLTLRSNVDLAYIVLPADFIRPSPSCDQWDLSVWKVPNSRFDSSGCRQIAYGLHYNPRTDFLFSKINMLGVEVAWGIRNLLGTETELIFNGAFWRLCRYILQVPLSSVCQVSLIVKALLQLKLLFKGHTLISGAAAELNGRGIVFAGLSGAGKTTTLLNFLEAFPARYVSEDVFFLADRRMRSFPNPIKKARFGFTTLFYTLFHILPYHLTRFEDPMQRFSGRFSTACRAPEDVFFLERSPDRGIFGLPTIEGLHKLGSLNNRVFLYFYERVLAAAAFIYPEMALVDLQRHQAAIFKEQLDGARYHVIRADHPREFIQLLQTHYRAVKGATAGAPQP